MSCHVVNFETLNVIYKYMRSEGVTDEICQATIAGLHQENVEAVNHRYGENAKTDELLWGYETSLFVFSAQAYGCMSYLAYQISDHRNYEFLPGLALLEKMQARILADLEMTDSQVRLQPEYTWGM